jgi:TonB family protein
VARGLVLLFALLLAADAFASPGGWRRLTPKPGTSAESTIVGYGVEAEGDSVEPALLVCRCREDSLELFVIADSALVAARQRLIDERIDASPPRSEPWMLSTDRGSLFAPDPRGLAERLVGAGRLWLGFGKARGLEFNVRGFEEPWGALRAACPPRPASSLPQLGEYVEVDELPEAISRVNPIYPPEAKAQRLEGTVVVQVLLGADGLVKDTRVVKSVPALDAAAVASARLWSFKPGMLHGRPVAVWVAVPIKFSLQ